MALLESIKIPLGTKMPTFSLEDSLGVMHNSEKLLGDKGLLVIFTCNHCPYALAVWPRSLKLAAYAKQLGIETVAINPNIHPDYPEDSVDAMAQKVNEWEIDFPYLADDKQVVAKDFKAQCTPDIYLFDENQKLYYHGRIDDNWQDEAEVTQEELKYAIKLMAGKKLAPQKQNPSVGCSIKWIS